MKSGICYLTGAGPGDPGLFTLKGRACLEQADVVVYDHLCHPELLRFAPAGAEKISAGKKAGAHTLTQDAINALLIEKTRAGHVVVRLKGGDPFLFGRGGEEAEALAGAGCRFEVVPGVSSALAGPAYAGIPVTHRAHNTVLTIFTGHEDPERRESSLDFAALASASGTKVLLMGMERLGAITRGLMSAGMDPTTPTAVVRWATLGRQETLVATLETVAARAEEAGFTAPAVVVFGSVVRLRKTLDWFEALPLFGKRIAVTRSRTQAGELLGRLRALGADAFELPTIRIEPAPDKRAFYELVLDAHIYDWIIFTSPNGVDAFFAAFFELYKDARDLGGARIAVIGPATAERVQSFHLQVDILPEKHVAEAVVEELQKETSVENLKFLVVRPEGGRDAVAAGLTRLGAIVDEAVAYRTVPETDDVAGGIRRFREEGADLITFTSSSTAENFHALGLPLPAGLAIASIGPVTSKTLKALGWKVDAEASPHDIPGLVDAIVREIGR